MIEQQAADEQVSASAAAGYVRPYEDLAYPGYAYPPTHPARLEVLGRLFGLTPPSATGSRVLELGCGDGANALAIAHTLPDAHVLALDGSPSAIGRGRELAAAAGIANADLRVADLSDLEWVEPLGPFDYVIAHGVYSWVPPGVRGAILECAQRCLSPHGIAFVSYNAYPGSYLRDMARDMLTFHVRGVTEPVQRLARARALMEAIIAAEDPTPFGKVLSEQLQRMLAASDALLYHDEMAPVSTPFYFHEFIEHAAAHGLQFLSEASLSDSQIRDVPERVGQLIAELPQDVIVREQYLDFVRNRMFRRTLLVRDSAPVRRMIEDRHLDDFAISSSARPEGGRFVMPGGTALSTEDPLLRAAMTELYHAWPESLPFAELKTRVAEHLGVERLPAPDSERLREALLEIYIGRVVFLTACPLPAHADPGDRPTAGALARAQHAAGKAALTTLLGENCVLDDPLERSILPLLDGTRDRGALASELDVSLTELDAALSSLARRGLMCA